MKLVFYIFPSLFFPSLFLSLFLPAHVLGINSLSLFSSENVSISPPCFKDSLLYIEFQVDFSFWLTSLCSYIIKYFVRIEICFRITLEIAYDTQLGNTKQILRFVVWPQFGLKIIHNIYRKKLQEGNRTIC